MVVTERLKLPPGFFPGHISESVVSNPFSIVYVADIDVAPNVNGVSFRFCGREGCHVFFPEHMSIDKGLLVIDGSSFDNWMRQIQRESSGRIWEYEIIAWPGSIWECCDGHIIKNIEGGRGPEIFQRQFNIIGEDISGVAFMKISIIDIIVGAYIDTYDTNICSKLSCGSLSAIRNQRLSQISQSISFISSIASSHEREKQDAESPFLNPI